MKKLKFLVSSLIAMLAFAIFAITGIKVFAADAVDGTYSVTAESFYTYDSTKDPSSKRNPDNTTVGIFSWTSGTKTNNYAEYGYKGGSSTSNPTDLSWDHEIIIGGTRKITVTIGTLASGQRAECTVYGYSENKTIKINGVSKTSTTKWEVTPATETITSGTSFDIDLVTNYVLLQIDVVISTNTSSTFYDVNYYDGENLVHTASVEEGATTSAYSYSGSRWGYDFVEWVDSNDNPFDFDTPIEGDLNLYATYSAWASSVISDSNTLDLYLMGKGYGIYGNTATGESTYVLTGTIYTVNAGNTCFETTTTTVGDFGTSSAAIKTGGSLNNHKNGVSLTVTKAGTLTVWAKNGSSGSRTFALYEDGDTSKVEDSASASSLAGFTLGISKAGTYELGSADGSMWFYYISFEEAAAVTPTVTTGTATGVDSDGNTAVAFIAKIENVTDVTLLTNMTFHVSATCGDKNGSDNYDVTTCYTALTSFGEGSVSDCAAAENTYYVYFVVSGITSDYDGLQLNVTFNASYDGVALTQTTFDTYTYTVSSQA